MVQYTLSRSKLRWLYLYVIRDVHNISAIASPRLHTFGNKLCPATWYSKIIKSGVTFDRVKYCIL